MFLAIGIILFILLVVVHEYGHFLVAKRNGIEVEEFGIGFPPKIAGKKMGKGIFEGYYTINWLPLGGFVKLKGETDQDKRKGSFGKAPFWSKVKVMLAGIFMNYLVGVLLFISLAYIGLPRAFDNQFAIGATEEITDQGVLTGQIVEGLPADLAGISTDDQIVEFAGQEITTTDQLIEIIKGNPGNQVEVLYEDASDGYARVSTELTLRPTNDDNQGLLGAGLYDAEAARVKSSWWSAPVNGFMFANRIFTETFRFIGSTVASAFQGDISEAGDNVAGPVGIVRELNRVDSISALIAITGNISVALAVANLLPIPGLDGGKLYTMLIFKALGKRLTEKWETAIYGTGVVLLLGLAVLITYSDISKIFN